LVGKTLAIISDARSGRTNTGPVVTERLLSISGEDPLPVERKYHDTWNGKLPCRLHIVSNELPEFSDASTAIIGRLIVVPTTESWLNREDHTLEETLREELPGILNWSLDGLDRLVANRNVFTRVESAEEGITVMRDVASPIAAYVRQNCWVKLNKNGTTPEIEVDLLYGDYLVWAENHGHPQLAKEMFGRDLRAVKPSLKLSRRRIHLPSDPPDKEVRKNYYLGIRLKTTDEELDEVERG
jgi:putative DNA primase/helicase